VKIYNDEELNQNYVLAMLDCWAFHTVKGRIRSESDVEHSPPRHSVES
jgi:hypothetical protein